MAEKRKPAKHRTVENTRPSLNTYNDLDFLALIVEAGKKYQEAENVLINAKGIHTEMWLAPCPIMYVDECVGYLVTEGDWVNYHAADYIEEESGKPE